MYGKTVIEKGFFLARALAASFWFFGCSLVALTVAVFRPFNTKNGTFFATIFPGFGLRILGIRLEIREERKLIDQQPCIYLCNHQHLVDLFTFSYALPANAVTLGKKDIRTVPIFGWLYWLSGHIFIDRKNNQSAVATMKQAADRMVRERLSLMIFPEGTRSRGKGMQPFKKGAFYLARETGFPLLPVVASDYFPSLNMGRFRAGTVLMEPLAPFHIPKDLDGENLERLIHETYVNMKAEQGRLDKELAQRTSEP